MVCFWMNVVVGFKRKECTGAGLWDWVAGDDGGCDGSEERFTYGSCTLVMWVFCVS